MERKDRRARILIEPEFQVRLLVRLAGWVAASTVLTGVLAYGAVGYLETLVEARNLASPLLMPAVALALVCNLTLTVLVALFYSRRLAGPVHRLRDGLERLARGEPVSVPFRLRSQDEFHDLADAFNRLAEKLRRSP